MDENLTNDSHNGSNDDIISRPIYMSIMETLEGKPIGYPIWNTFEDKPSERTFVKFSSITCYPLNS